MNAHLVKYIVSLVSLVALCLGATSLQAQSDTGRHRAEPVASEENTFRRWWIAAGAGVMTSGDLFKVTVDNGVAIPWLPPAGGEFRSDKFTVTFDEDLDLALSLGLRFSRHLTLRGDLSWASVAATAEARVGQTVELYLYENFTFIMAALGLEMRLLATPSTPYLLIAAALVDFRADQAKELDQTQLGARIGVGYEHALGANWTIGVEIRDTIVSLDTEDYRPEAATPSYPEITYTPITPQHVFEILAQARLSF